MYLSRVRETFEKASVILSNNRLSIHFARVGDLFIDQSIADDLGYKEATGCKMVFESMIRNSDAVILTVMPSGQFRMDFTGNGEANVGAYVTVESARAKNIKVEAEIILQSGVTLEDAKANIESEIVSYLKSTVFEDSYISYAKIGACILKADGVLDYKEDTFKINNAKDNIILTDSDEVVEIAVLNEVNVSIGQ